VNVIDRSKPHFHKLHSLHFFTNVPTVYVWGMRGFDYMWRILSIWISGFVNPCCVSLQNYVTCALGIHYVGYVMMCFGASNSLCSFLFGRLARYTGRAALFLFGNFYFIRDYEPGKVFTLSSSHILLRFYWIEEEDAVKRRREKKSDILLKRKY